MYDDDIDVYPVELSLDIGYSLRDPSLPNGWENWVRDEAKSPDDAAEITFKLHPAVDDEGAFDGYGRECVEIKINGENSKIPVDAALLLLGLSWQQLVDEAFKVDGNNYPADWKLPYEPYYGV